MINRWTLSISTTAGVILFTMGFLSMLEQQKYLMAGLFLLFAFWLPLQSESVKDKALKRRPRKQHDDVADDSGSREARGISD